MADQDIIHKTEYIERERIEKFFDGIYDCADLTFEPNDHCCAADDCAHCKWREAMDAIKKRILSIPAADVRPVVRVKWIEDWETGYSECPACHDTFLWEDYKGVAEWNFCPNCGARMEES